MSPRRHGGWVETWLQNFGYMALKRKLLTKKRFPEMMTRCADVGSDFGVKKRGTGFNSAFTVRERHEVVLPDIVSVDV